MRMEIGLSQTLSQKQILSPQMIQSMEILVLNSQQLDERIEQELEENIALELLDSTDEGGSDDRASDDASGDGDAATASDSSSDTATATDPSLSDASVDPTDAAGIDSIASEIDDLRERFEHLAEFQSFDRANSPGGMAPRGEEDDKLDALNNTADAPPTLQEHLEEQLQLRSDLWLGSRFATFDPVLAQIAQEQLARTVDTEGSAGAVRSNGLEGDVAPSAAPAVVPPEIDVDEMTDEEIDLREIQFRALCSEIVFNLDEHGRLRYRPEDIAASLARATRKAPESEMSDEAVTLDEVLRAIWTIQQLDPPGVGAIGVGKEAIAHCLLLQLERDPGEYPLETIVIRDHLDDIAKNRLPQVARATGSSVEEIKDVIEIIRELDPLPGKPFSTERNVAVKPDVHIEEVEGEYRVIVDEASVPRLRISPYYLELLEKSRRDPEIRKYLKSKVDNAEWLLHAIQQRKSTLQRVAEEVVQHQQGYFKEGIRGLRPLKMQDIADIIGVNVSTVSRAISGKYFQAPGIIKELKFLFTGGTLKDDGTTESRDAVILRIKDLIADEDTKKPYSDAKIVQLLAKDGIHISRRTVTKYREAENIPSSRERRTF